MEISKAAVMSIVLLGLGIGMMIPPIFQVYVTNFPTQPEPKTVIVCANVTVTSHYYPIASVNLQEIHAEGYQKIRGFVIYRSIIHSEIWCQPTFQNVTTHPRTHGSEYIPIYDTGWEWDSAVMEIPEGVPACVFMSYNIDINAELTIMLYCYN